MAAATLVAGLGLTGGSAVATPSAAAQHASAPTASTGTASTITTSVPDTIAGTTSGWSTFALGENVRGTATVTAPTGTRIAEVKVAGSGAHVPFTVSADGRTAVNDDDDAFNSTWRRILVRLTVDPTATTGTTLDDGSIAIAKDGATLAEGTLAVHVAAPSAITTTVPDTDAGTTSGWSTFALGVNVRGTATVTAPTGTRIAEVKVAGSGAKVPFEVSEDGRTAVNDDDNAFNSTWRRILVRLAVDPTATPGTTLDDGSIAITENGATLARGTLSIRVAGPAVSPVTATAAFTPDDLHAPATVRGAGTDGAEVVVRNAAGDEVGRTEVRDGAYSVPVAPEHATWGVNAFSVTQTVVGGATTTASTTLDYGSEPTAPQITTPEDGSETEDSELTFAGTGASGTRVQLADETGTLSDSVVVGTDRQWTLPTNRRLPIGDHRVEALQTGNGGLSTTSTIHVVRKFLEAYLLTPRTVHEARPEVWGIATRGSHVTFGDSRGNIYAETTVDDDDEYRVRFTHDLREGPTTVYLLQELDGESKLNAFTLT